MIVSIDTIIDSFIFSARDCCCSRDMCNTIIYLLKKRLLLLKKHFETVREIFEQQILAWLRVYQTHNLSSIKVAHIS